MLTSFLHACSQTFLQIVETLCNRSSYHAVITVEAFPPAKLRGVAERRPQRVRVAQGHGEATVEDLTCNTVSQSGKRNKLKLFTTEQDQDENNCEIKSSKFFE